MSIFIWISGVSNKTGYFKSCPSQQFYNSNERDWGIFNSYNLNIDHPTGNHLKEKTNSIVSLNNSRFEICWGSLVHFCIKCYKKYYRFLCATYYSEMNNIIIFANILLVLKDSMLNELLRYFNNEIKYEKLIYLLALKQLLLNETIWITIKCETIERCTYSQQNV